MPTNAFRNIQRKFGKSYFFATQLFPKELREDTYTLYAFVRIPDEFVDNPEKGVNPRQKLLDWREKWRQGGGGETVLEATKKVFEKYKIPYQYSEDFFSAMLQDTEKTRYANYAELKHYMYGSAAVVGLMMSYIIGFTDPKALKYAESLGYAMQLTNFLRDIKEDYERGRIYMPQDELKNFGLSEQNIAEGNLSKEFMQFQIARADAYYDEALKGITLLNKRGQFAVRIALFLYREILRKIEKQNYDVFIKRAHTSHFDKLLILIREAFR